MSFPPSWQSSWTSHLPQIRSIQRTLPSFQPLPSHIPRISQLDTSLLDEELAQLLQDPLAKAFDGLGLGGAWRGVFNLELGLVVRLILWKMSIWDSAASYGAQLQGLKLVDARSASSSAPIRRKKLLLHAILTLGIPYLHARLRAHALSHAWPDRPPSSRLRLAWSYLISLENAHSLLALLGFMSFLWDGRYRTISDRLLGLRLVPSRRVDRVVSYEFMNRQIVWHALTEFLIFLIPLLDLPALRRRLRQNVLALRNSSNLPTPLKSLLNSTPSTARDQASQKGPFADLPTAECPICAQRAALPNLSYPLSNQLAASSIIGASIPTYPLQTPYVTSCGHRYCYVCITEKMAAAADEGEEGWGCLRCGERVRSAGRVKTVERDEERGEEGEDLGDPDAVAAEGS